MVTFHMSCEQIPSEIASIAKFTLVGSINTLRFIYVTSLDCGDAHDPSDFQDL